MHRLSTPRPYLLGLGRVELQILVLIDDRGASFVQIDGYGH
jgi:hypothetical protein